MIYLDHAAATPVSDKALQAMLPYFAEQFFNPSAPYLPAKRVREAYEAAKNTIAHTIGAKGVDLVMTAGATESINLAFTVAQGKVLALATEHAAVLETAKQHDFTLIKVDKNGLIDIADLHEKLTDEVDFISISLANNELGTIQPLAEIAEIIRAERQRRLQVHNSTPLYFHSDASQALNLLDINVARLGVDLLTVNAAKCGGPKGVGALYVAHGVKLIPVNAGGGQERGLRSGTENVPGVIGFAAAAVEAKAHLAGNRKKYQKMTQILRQELSKLNCSERKNSQLKPSKSTTNPTKTLATEQSSALHTSIVAHNDEKVNRKNESFSDCYLCRSRENTGFSSTRYPQQDNSFSQNSCCLRCSSGKKGLLSQQSKDKADFVHFLGQSKHQLANFCPICFPGIDAERLIYRLESRGVLVSTGAACAANKGSKSHVLAAIGLSDEEIAGSIRISLGSTNTLEDIQKAAQIIREEVEREYERINRG